MPFENKFRPLTPNDAIDLHHYREALDYVFSSGKIRNIALTGSYGSGKSSVIRSYENLHKDDRIFIHISLARFEEQGQSAENPVDPAKTVNIFNQRLSTSFCTKSRRKNFPRPTFSRRAKSPGNAIS